MTLAGVEDLTDQIAKDLIDAGCVDGVPSSRDGVVIIHFFRDAPSLEEAVASVTAEIERAGHLVLRNTDGSVFQRRSWLQVAISTIGDGVIVIDGTRRVTFLNPVAETLTGWSLAESLGDSVDVIFKIFHKSTKAVASRVAQDVIRRAIRVELGRDSFLVDRSGSVRSIDGSAAPITDARAKTIGAVIVFRDITERRAIEAAAARANEADALARDYAQSIVATVRESLLILDSQLHVKSANRAFYETFGVTPDETEEEFFYSLGNGQWNIPELKTLLEDILPQNPALEGFEVTFDFARIGRKTVLLNARRLRDHDRGELILLAIEDITERRAAENAWRDAERRKDEFIAVLSHELRNPLSAISTASEVLRLTEDEEDRASCVGVIHHQVNNLQRLIEDLLDITRISQGKLQLRKQVIDHSAVIARAVESVSKLIDEQEHELIVSIPSKPMAVEADPTRLEQVIGNLLTNAAKFTSKRVQIKVEAEADQGHVIVKVRDNGARIAPEMIPRLFDIFTQDKLTMGRSRGGLGIGLSLVKNLVELHGGAVDVMSDGPGRGSEFRILLPALIR